MTDLTTPKASAKAAAGKDPDAENPVEEVRYDTDYLVANARSLLRSRPTIVAGALSSEKRKTHSLAQAEELVKDYLKRPAELEV